MRGLANALVRVRLIVVTIVLKAKRLIKTGYPKEYLILGQHIRSVRMERQLKQFDVAEIFHTHVSTIKSWETGRRKILPEFIDPIINYLGYNPLIGEGKTLGEKVKLFRKEKNVKRDSLRKQVGINWDTLCRIEADNPRVEIRNREKMEQYLAANM
ncbi:MAG: helix-turn-helix transcriptional regulator [Sphingobacteriales bacterium JAD_PAG50586_3]|nr:MAG: helix-turn-helix transcriptional regulator [Sphingobacteriales bacterium JAD_PAG50586_3]